MNKVLEIKSTEQLAAAFPELVIEITDQAKRSVDVEAPRKEAADEEKDRILALVNIHFGEEVGAKFKALVESGLDAKQYQAVKDLEPEKAPDADDEAQAQAAALKAIENAGPDNPGSGGAATTKDFMAMVAGYRAAHKCGVVDAQKAVMKQCPEAHAAYIKSVN